MTLIVGFFCRDGFTISGDSEIGTDPVTHQSKLIGTGAPKGDYRLVVGGAGSGDYLDEVMQRIGDQVALLPQAIPDAVEEVVREEIDRIFVGNIFKHWEASDPYRPNLSLIVGLRRGDEHRLWKTGDRTVSRVDEYAFVGSGRTVADYLGQKLFRRHFTTAEAHHVAEQIMREAKARSSGVGGNTDTWSVCVPGSAPFFQVARSDADPDNPRFLWSLDAHAMAANRLALTGADNDGSRMRLRLKQFVDGVERLRNCALAPMQTAGENEWQTVEIGVPDLHPFEDLR